MMPAYQPFLSSTYLFFNVDHRRRSHAEEKAKVVTAVWGITFIQFLAVLVILNHVDLKNRMNSSFSSCHPGAINPFLHVILLVQLILFFISSGWKTASVARNWINSVPQILFFCDLNCVNIFYDETFKRCFGRLMLFKANDPYFVKK